MRPRLGVVDRLRAHFVQLFFASALALSLIAATVLAAPSTAGAAPAVSTTVYLNLRTGPSLNYRIITVMPPGSPVAIRGEQQNGFYPVIYQGTNGWAYGAYLRWGSSDQSATYSGGRVSTVNNSTTSPSLPSSRAATVSSSVSSGSSIVDIIYAAAARYGQSGAAMLSVARCESSLNPNAYNRSSGASGLFQFLPSTWRTTPYAGDNIFDPWANANAAAWMWSVGRQREWVCQP